MKKIFFFILFVSKFLISSNSDQLIHPTLTPLAKATYQYLQQFNDMPTYKESKDHFVARMKQKFGDNKVVFTKHKNQHLLGIFHDDIQVNRHGGFWGGDDAAFYLSFGCKIIGQKQASLQEKGFYEWIINVPATLSGKEFDNKDLQHLVENLLKTPEFSSSELSEVIVPVIPYAFEKKQKALAVCFTKEIKTADRVEIIARLRGI